LYFSISLGVLGFLTTWPLIGVTCFTLAFTTRPLLSSGGHAAAAFNTHPSLQWTTTTTTTSSSRRWLHHADDDVVVSESSQHASSKGSSNEKTSSSDCHGILTKDENDEGDPGDEDNEAVYYSPNAPLVERDQKDEQQKGDFNSRSSVSVSNSNSMNEYSFFDEAIVYVRAGSGGQGANSYSSLNGSHSKQQGPPDGGNGGRGGSVILQVDASLNTLAGLSFTANRPNAFGGSGATAKATVSSSFRPKSFRAEKGMDGAGRFRAGRNGKDIVIRVPPGTLVQEIEVVQDEDENSQVLLDVGTLTNQPPAVQKTSLIVAHGGQGGEGTGALVKKGGGTRQGRGGGGTEARQSARGGERRMLKLTLQIVADVALVGVPNAGKSTFLAAVTRAKPKIASYAFTTVVPNLGVWIPNFEQQQESPSFSSVTVGNDDREGLNEDDAGDDGGGGTAAAGGLVLCDVPGLIAGAADGVGLGHAFLRHVERCHVMVHLIDATSHDPIADYLMLNREIVRYNGTSTSSSSATLANMPQVVIVNKVDVFENQNDDNDADRSGSVKEDWEEGLKVRWSREELQEKLKAVMPHSRLLWMSAKDRTGVESVMTRLAAFVQKVKLAKQQELKQH
jgi:GTPase